MNPSNNHQHSTYQPSGDSSPLSFLICIILSISVIPLSGIAYSLIIWHIPIVYFNFFVTGGFGVVLGLLVYPVVRWGHVRSRKMEHFFMILIFLTGFYVSWAAHMTLAYNATGEGNLIAHTRFSWGDFTAILGNPANLFFNIVALSKYGLWSIGPLPINGFVLWFVWILEAFVIGMVMWKVNRKWSLFPYSEIDRNWSKKMLLKKKMTLHRGISKFIDGLHINNLAPLLEAPLTSSHNMEYTELALYDSPGDQTAYLSFFNKTLGRDNKGNKKVEYHRIGDFHTISKQQKEALINHFG